MPTKTQIINLGLMPLIFLAMGIMLAFAGAQLDLLIKFLVLSPSGLWGTVASLVGFTVGFGILLRLWLCDQELSRGPRRLLRAMVAPLRRRPR